WSGTYAGHSSIMQAEVDPATGAVLEEPRPLWSGTGLAHPEAPHVFRRGEHWYLVIAEGGTERGHTVAVARSDSPRGPFAGAPHNPLLTHRSTSLSVQNTGHADLVECPDGSWAMVYLGVRARGGTPHWHVNGRETFLAGIVWEDGWPTVVEDAFAVPPFPSTMRLDPGAPLDLHWVSPGARLDTFVTPGADGLALAPSEDDGLALLARRCLDERWAATVTVDPGDGVAELRLHLDHRHWYAVRAGATEVVAVARIGDVEHEVARTAHAGAPVVLGLAAVQARHGGPDDIVLSVAADGGGTSEPGGASGAAAGELRELARLDGRYLSTEVAGGFTGRVWGLRGIGAPIAVLQASYEPRADG
ncbi:MAG: family 43 glycosylhydrolase, partial [Demequina sp.]|uniref:family 43 glycosylhydrolase n=1 Tax=Demequina sp. TaxID=2050685 RepID=UPI003A870D7F